MSHCKDSIILRILKGAIVHQIPPGCWRTIFGRCICEHGVHFAETVHFNGCSCAVVKKQLYHSSKVCQIIDTDITKRHGAFRLANGHESAGGIIVVEIQFEVLVAYCG